MPSRSVNGANDDISNVFKFVYFFANERICWITQTPRKPEKYPQCFHLGERKKGSGKKTGYICNHFHMQGTLQMAFFFIE